MLEGVKECLLIAALVLALGVALNIYLRSRVDKDDVWRKWQ